MSVNDDLKKLLLADIKIPVAGQKTVSPKQYFAVLKAMKQHLLKGHDLVEEGYYTGVYMSLGLSLGLVFSAVFGNGSLIGLGLPIGLGIGLSIGASLDVKAKKEGRVI